MKRGFTLIEILVVVAILGVLMSIFVFAFRKAPDQAKKALCEDRLKQVVTALEVCRNKPSSRRLFEGSDGEPVLDEEVAYVLASELSCEKDAESGKLSGHDRFGLVSPWAEDVIKNLGSSCTLSSEVPSGGTIRDHRLYYAVATPEDEDAGYISANVGGEEVRIRATAAVWCAGADGRLEPYSKGLKGDDVYSWTQEQIVR